MNVYVINKIVKIKNPSNLRFMIDCCVAMFMLSILDDGESILCYINVSILCYSKTRPCYMNTKYKQLTCQ